MELIIRAARPDEIDLVHEMGRNAFQKPDGFDWGWTPEYLRWLLDPDFGLCHVAEADGKLVGCHCGVWRYPESSEVQCRMYWMYVDPLYRQLGVAARLLEHALEEARRRGKTSVCIGIWDGDAAAEKLVRRQGFGPVSGLTIFRREL